MTQDLRHAVSRYIDRHGDADGFAATPVPGFGMMRAYAPNSIVKTIYKPLVCIILQGAKHLVLTSGSHVFPAGSSAIISADVPVVSRVTQASRMAPFLAVAMELDLGVLRELAAHVDEAPAATVPPVLLDETDDAVADCALRLLRLLDRPDAIALLYPSLLRELHYWLLAGRHGAAIRSLARPDGVAQRIARAVAVLRAGFDQPLRMDRLADVAGMSVSTFNQHFRAVTSLSPLQFQKQLRLIEARRRMVSDGVPASQAAFEVGYQSVPQFTREYGRMFGLPPARDAGDSRAAWMMLPGATPPERTPSGRRPLVTSAAPGSSKPSSAPARQRRQSSGTPSGTHP